MKTNKTNQDLAKTIMYMTGLMLLLFITWRCTSPTDSEEADTLYVKFINEAQSGYIITNIQLQAMGKADEDPSPSGVWSKNILQDTVAIAPGEHKFFTLNIPNLHWSQYRLGVSDGQGGTIMLHEQEGFTSAWVLPITHWGSDERTVSVHLAYDQTGNFIYVSGYTDMAGIEN